MGRRWIHFGCAASKEWAKPNDSVTCIVSTCKNAKRLRLCLASLVMQDPNVQIVVTDASDDLHGRRWNHAVCQAFNVNYVLNSDLDKAENDFAAANAVAPFALGNWLAFLDDSTIVTQDFSSSIMETSYAHPDWEIIRFNLLSSKAQAVIHDMTMRKWNFAIKKDTFLLTGGFFPAEPFPRFASDTRHLKQGSVGGCIAVNNE